MKPERPLAWVAQLDPALTESELSDAWSSIETSRRRKVQRRARRRGAVVALALAGVVGAAVWFWPRSAAELRAADGTAFHRVAAAQTVQLNDGSTVTTTADGELEVLQNSRSTLALHLLSGAARFEVTPGTGRHWTVEAGDVAVEVTGTIFQVERHDGQVKVGVERGSVIVRGSRVADGVKRLSAGEDLLVEAPGNDATPPPPEPPRVFEPPRLPASRESTVQTAASMMAAADRSRREGHPGDAIAQLWEVAERWPASPEAPLAAFTAANLLDDAGDHPRAQHWYRRSLDLGLTGPLADSARRALGEAQ